MLWHFSDVFHFKCEPCPTVCIYHFVTHLCLWILGWLLVLRIDVTESISRQRGMQLPAVNVGGYTLRRQKSLIHLSVRASHLKKKRDWVSTQTIHGHGNKILFTWHLPAVLLLGRDTALCNSAWCDEHLVLEWEENVAQRLLGVFNIPWFQGKGSQDTVNCLWLASWTLQQMHLDGMWDISPWPASFPFLQKSGEIPLVH